jgi:FkbM family methyltransferase
MLNYLKKKYTKFIAKRTFSEYDNETIVINIPNVGSINFTRWLNPLEKEKTISGSQINFYKKFLKKGDFVIDIGAHIGDTTLPMALAVGAEGTVLAFDPNPLVFKILQKNADLNRSISNIIPIPYAIAVEEGEYSYSSSEASFNNGGISGKNGKFGLEQKVKGVNLQKFIHTEYPNTSKISLIKVDAEGYDIQILQSISALIDQYKPNLIFECFKDLPKEERFALYDYIANKGYQINKMDDFEEDAAITPLKKENMIDWKHFDIIAYPI